nr:hypothetical protein GCM10020093_051140 [Planobispora longispora]
MLTGVGRADEAVTVLRRVRAACERHGEHWARAYSEILLARVELMRDRPAAAGAYARASLRTKHRLRDRVGVATALDVLACAEVGRAESAARLLGLAQRLWETLGRPQAGIPEWVAAREACERRNRRALGSGPTRSLTGTDTKSTWRRVSPGRSATPTADRRLTGGARRRRRLTGGARNERAARRSCRPFSAFLVTSSGVPPLPVLRVAPLTFRVRSGPAHDPDIA